jgi:hypothetical protein
MFPGYQGNAFEQKVHVVSIAKIGDWGLGIRDWGRRPLAERLRHALLAIFHAKAQRRGGAKGRRGRSR